MARQNRDIAPIDPNPSPDLKGIEVRCLILLVRCGKEILASFGLSQVKIKGDYFLVSAHDRNNAVFGDNAITVLIASDGNRIPTWGTETRQDNRHLD